MVSKRFSRPGTLLPKARSRFVSSTVTSLFDYGVIGNMHTASLISNQGSIDWACMPRFASPSVFGRLLDPKKGGFQQVSPVERFVSTQSYRASTNILETFFHLSNDRSLQVTDFMPIFDTAASEEATMIVRRIEARRGPVPIRTAFAPAFDYAQARTQVGRADGRILATAGSYQMAYVPPPGETRMDSDRVETSSEVRPGVPVTVELFWGGRRPTADSAEKLLDRTERYWRRWIADSLPRRQRVSANASQRVERSTLLLKLLSHRDTGAFVAAPTTSLPEWPGGTRNWDYRYSWVRDTAMIATALTRLGLAGEARSFLRWSLGRSHLRKDGKICVLYGVHGETDLTERELPHLSGYLNSRPVRIGNGAEYQFQLDIYGSLLSLAYQMTEVDAPFVALEWPQIAQLATDVMELWGTPDCGIWEVRGPPVNYVHSKLMAWVALDRASRLAVRFGHRAEAMQWGEEATKVRTAVLAHGFDRRVNAFVQSFEHHVADASVLRIPIEGMLPYTDPRVLGTIEYVRRHLARGPFVYRYRRPDGIAGPEGAFLLCSFWLIECLARSGQRELAEEYWNALMASSGPLGLFSEEFDPKSGIPLGNFPQAFTHIGVIQAALALEHSDAVPAGVNPPVPKPSAGTGKVPASPRRSS